MNNSLQRSTRFHKAQQTERALSACTHARTQKHNRRNGHCPSARTHARNRHFLRGLNPRPPLFLFPVLFNTQSTPPRRCCACLPCVTLLPPPPTHTYTHRQSRRRSRVRVPTLPAPRCGLLPRRGLVGGDGPTLRPPAGRRRAPAPLPPRRPRVVVTPTPMPTRTAKATATRTKRSR